MKRLRSITHERNQTSFQCKLIAVHWCVHLDGCVSIRTSSGIMSLSLTSCERDTLAVRWYSTNSLSELNFTTHRKNLPCASRNTLKCCTPSEHLKKPKINRKIVSILTNHSIDWLSNSGFFFDWHYINIFLVVAACTVHSRLELSASCCSPNPHPTWAIESPIPVPYRLSFVASEPTPLPPVFMNYLKNMLHVTSKFMLHVTSLVNARLGSGTRCRSYWFILVGYPWRALVHTCRTTCEPIIVFNGICLMTIHFVFFIITIVITCHFIIYASEWSINYECRRESNAIWCR